MVCPYSFRRLFIYRFNELRKFRIASSSIPYTYPIVKVTPQARRISLGIRGALNAFQILVLRMDGDGNLWRMSLENLNEFKIIIILASFKISQLLSGHDCKVSSHPFVARLIILPYLPNCNSWRIWDSTSLIKLVSLFSL